MTDQECARTLRRLIGGLQVVEPEEITAVNRACELLEREHIAESLGASHVVKGHPNESPDALWRRAQTEAAIKNVKDKYR